MPEKITPVTDADRAHLKACVVLAEAALEAGDEPFGSLLVDTQGCVLAEDRNRVSGGDATRHPEFALARWAAENLSPEQRATSTVYTSGEHCAMCAAAHAWVGLGRIVYASSTPQLLSWMDRWGAGRPPIAALRIQDVAPDVEVSGPDQDLASEVERLHRRRLEKQGAIAADRTQ